MRYVSISYLEGCNDRLCPSVTLCHHLDFVLCKEKEYAILTYVENLLRQRGFRVYKPPIAEPLVLESRTRISGCHGPWSRA